MSDEWGSVHGLERSDETTYALASGWESGCVLATDSILGKTLDEEDQKRQ